MNVLYNFINYIVGEYWINPNLGPIYDAIQVRCDFRNKRTFTCVKPEVKVVSVVNLEMGGMFEW